MEKAGAKGGIVIDHNKGTTSANSPLFSMSGDGTDDISIPMVFLFSNDAKELLETLQAGGVTSKVEVVLMDLLDADSKDSESVEETNEIANDITSPVRSFLEKSKRQVENYLRDKFSISENVPDQEVHEDTESIFISKEGDGTITGIVRDSQGLDHKFVKAASSGEQIDQEFHSLEHFLNPESAAIKKLIEHRVLKNPNVLSELLEVSFKDLLKVFNKLMGTKAASLEAAYLHLLQLAEEEGALGISNLAKTEDELIEAVSAVDSNDDRVAYKMNEKAKLNGESEAEENTRRNDEL